jgi:carbon starvation protein
VSLLIVVLASAVVLAVAYRVYGSLLVRLLRLDPNAPTPAVALRDDVDYVPTEPKFLMGQHFSAIAAAGPIVGPILAGVMFGWAPALAWIWSARSLSAAYTTSRRWSPRSGTGRAPSPRSCVNT